MQMQLNSASWTSKGAIEAKIKWIAITRRRNQFVRLISFTCQLLAIFLCEFYITLERRKESLLFQKN